MRTRLLCLRDATEIPIATKLVKAEAMMLIISMVSEVVIGLNILSGLLGSWRGACKKRIAQNGRKRKDIII